MPQVKKFYRELEHAGDLAIEVFGGTRAELFAHALTAMARLMVEEKGIGNVARQEYECAAADDLDLMHDVLARALNLFLIDGFMWREAKVEEKSRDRLLITLCGEQYDPSRHRFLREIKGVTFHRLFTGRGRDGWRAEIIFDV